MFLTSYYKKNCNYNYLNKYSYLNINELPEIKRIKFIFIFNSYNLKLLAAHFLVLQQISNVNHGIFFKAKKSILVIKIKKGNITGCEFFIKKTKFILIFFKKFILEILFCKQQNFFRIYINQQSIYYKVKNIILLTKLDKLFNIYNVVNKSNLHIVITVRRNRKKQELFYLLKKLKLNTYISLKS